MNVAEKVREMRQRIAAKAPAGTAMDGATRRRREELSALHDSYASLHRLRHSVGVMPPVPPTLRGRVGSWFVRIVQKMLFWYTPQILRFHEETVRTLDNICQLLELGWTEAGDEGEQMRLLNLELLRLRADTARMAHSPTAPAGPAATAFQFAIQDHFRGTEDEVRRKLQIYLPAIRRISVAAGPWLDIGCGRGEWLELAATMGSPARGVDSSPASVAYCRGKGLEAIEGDAVEYLQTLPAGSVAVLTVFHFFEHCTMNYLTALLGEIARVMAPGGLLISETPDPTNLPVGANLFWRDPTRQRPLPMELLEFMLTYLGLTVIERLRLNPKPEEEQLPLAEIELVKRLNEHLYGPQDYGLIARR